MFVVLSKDDFISLLFLKFFDTVKFKSLVNLLEKLAERNLKSPEALPPTSVISFNL
ncbi:hypothetical protein [Clostridium botulinum]|uniref:hypothetical protein n=1 Tax=Clostridium botulinum TaxID=1491 RepID=UPI001CBD64D5|nr:hypothetical protein [Clostridium botulinum]